MTKYILPALLLVIAGLMACTNTTPPKADPKPPPPPPVTIVKDTTRKLVFDEAGRAYRKIFAEDVLAAIAKGKYGAIDGPDGFMLGNLEKGADTLDVFFKSPTLGALKDVRFVGKVNLDHYSKDYGSIAGSLKWKGTKTYDARFIIRPLTGVMEISPTDRNNISMSFHLKDPTPKTRKGG